MERASHLEGARKGGVVASDTVSLITGGQVLQNRLSAGPIAGVLAYIRPDNSTRRVNDEDGWGGNAIAE